MVILEAKIVEIKEEKPTKETTIDYEIDDEELERLNREYSND